MNTTMNSPLNARVIPQPIIDEIDRLKQERVTGDHPNASNIDSEPPSVHSKPHSCDRVRDGISEWLKRLTALDSVNAQIGTEFGVQYAPIRWNKRAWSMVVLMVLDGDASRVTNREAVREVMEAGWVWEMMAEMGVEVAGD